jgi:GNAT superfamily N-acetyltransferase
MLACMEIRRIAAGDVDDVVRLWNVTKRDTYDFIALEQNRTLAEDGAFFRARILPCCSIWIACEGSAVLGFLAMNGSYVDRLYVHPRAQRRGIGRALLIQAMELSPQGIELHTHQKNLKARAFYEKNGLRAVCFGVSPAPESEPDVEYQWRPAR